MMALTLNRLQSRVLAVLLLVLTVLLVYLGFVRPYTATLSGLQDDIDRLNDRLVRYRSVATAQQDVDRRLLLLQKDPQLAASFLSQKTAALASAELQQLVKRMVRESGGQLVSTQALASEPGGDFAAVTVKVVMRGSSENLHDLLRKLELGRPLLIVDGLSIRNMRRYARANQPVAERLTVNFDLTGYLWPRADAPAS